jgi:hypothetical protein
MAGTKTGTFPECDFCTGTCDDEKIQLVYEDPEFTKTFINNLLDSKLDDIVNDAYLMAETVSGRTNPMEIADFAYCIYVNLSQLVEMEPEKRMEIAVSFKQEFDKMVETIQTGREVAKKVEPAPEPVPAKKSPKAGVKTGKIELKPVSVPAAQGVLASKVAKPAAKNENEAFLLQLDADIAEMVEMSGQVDKFIAETEDQLSPTQVKPVQAPVVTHAQLEPVVRQPASKAAKQPEPEAGPLGITPPRPREPGSKENPIKLTPELLEGNVVNVQDINKVEKGIKIKRVDIQKFTPQALSASGGAGTIDVTKLGKGAPAVGAPGKRGKNASEDLFQAFNEVKAKGKERDKALPRTFTPEILGTAAKKAPARDEASLDFSSLDAGDEAEQDHDPAKEKAGSLSLAFEDEGTHAIGKKGSSGGRGRQKAAPFVAEKGPVDEDHELSFSVPFTLDEPRPSKGKKVDDADRVKVCHECNAVNPIKNKFCAKCGTEF